MQWSRLSQAPRWARLGAGLAVAAALIATAGSAAAAPASAPGGSPVVPTATGLVQGKTAGPISEYLGIPYAAPPVGALRWQPPQPAAPWHGIREATSFAPHCAQPGSPFGVASTSENCLYLNVFTPAGARGRNLPVMVWIHGGALVVGESDDYNPAALVQRRRHRGHHQLPARRCSASWPIRHWPSRPGGPSGNYGLMDQQAALRWVQRNIGGFGGDARNVTVFGESAGGLSTLAQLVSPGARGLFQRAIAESGTYDLTQQPRWPSAEAAGAAFAAKVGLRQQHRRLPAQPAGLDDPGQHEHGRVRARRRRDRAHPVDRARAGQRPVQPRAGDHRDEP